MRSTILPVLAALTAHASAAVLTFDTEPDFTNNFRAGDVAMVWGDLSGNGTMRHSGNNNTATAIYDLNGTAAGSTTFAVTIGSSLTVTADVMVTGNNSSFGIFFVGSNGGNLALLNVNSGNDQFRLFSGSSLTGSAGGNTGLPNDTTADVFSAGAFQSVSATYTALTSNSYRISMTTGGKTVSYDFTGAPLTDIQVAFRAYNGADTGNTVHIDNVNIIPEPSAATLALGAAGLFFLRRRR